MALSLISLMVKLVESRHVSLLCDQAYGLMASAPFHPTQSFGGKTTFSRFSFSHLGPILVNKVYFGLFCSFNPKLPRIPVRLHHNANKKN